MTETRRMARPPHPPLETSAMNPISTLCWSEIKSPLGPLMVAASARGVCAVKFVRDKTKFAQDFKGRPRLQKNSDTLARVMAQLREYFSGQRDRFDLPVDLSALTRFQREVAAVTRRIPAGQTWTYGQVAEKIGRPNAARPVGQALARNPIPIIVPCHRVIAGDGGLGGYSAGSGLKTKLWLLRHEGAPSVP